MRVNARLISKPTKSHKTMRLDDKLIMAVQKMADNERRSFGNMVEVLLDKAIKA
jgi:hypothetical protein